MQASMPTAVNDLPPLWKRSPKKFRSVHQAVIQLSLMDWEKTGHGPSLAKFISDYIGKLPEDLPAEVILDITKWAATEWAAWHAEKPEPEMA